jgi:hypothetical protein
MGAGAVGDDLQGHVRFAGYLDQVAELGAHQVWTADLPAQRGFIDDRPQLEGIWLAEQALPIDTGLPP